MSELLTQLGARVRRERRGRGLSRRQLSEACGVSERFLAQLEGGSGNISLLRFADVARALGMSPATLLAAAEQVDGSQRSVALLGLRGAGKSSVGAALGKRLGLAFVELDQRVEQMAGLSLGQLFELHGEAYYRRLEREALEAMVSEPSPMVLAPGGSIVGSPENFALLRRRCTTVWLRATPEDHWNRVIQQGDHRPMAQNPQAFEELRSLLTAREELYRTADYIVDTSGRSVLSVVKEVVTLVAA